MVATISQVTLYPPAGGTTTTVNGRSYTAADSVGIVVPIGDAIELEANGWFRAPLYGGGGGGSLTAAALQALLNANIFYGTFVPRNGLFSSVGSLSLAANDNEVGVILDPQTGGVMSWDNTGVGHAMFGFETPQVLTFASTSATSLAITKLTGIIRIKFPTGFTSPSVNVTLPTPASAAALEGMQVTLEFPIPPTGNPLTVQINGTTVVTNFAAGYIGGMTVQMKWNGSAWYVLNVLGFATTGHLGTAVFGGLAYYETDLAIGYQAQAQASGGLGAGWGAFAFGPQATASGNAAVAVGGSAKAIGTSTISFGGNSYGQASFAAAGATTYAGYSIAIGLGASGPLSQTFIVTVAPSLAGLTAGSVVTLTVAASAAAQFKAGDTVIVSPGGPGSTVTGSPEFEFTVTSVTSVTPFQVIGTLSSALPAGSTYGLGTQFWNTNVCFASVALGAGQFSSGNEFVISTLINNAGAQKSHFQLYAATTGATALQIGTDGQTALNTQTTAGLNLGTALGSHNRIYLAINRVHKIKLKAIAFQALPTQSMAAGAVMVIERDMIIANDNGTLRQLQAPVTVGTDLNFTGATAPTGTTLLSATPGTTQPTVTTTTSIGLLMNSAYQSLDVTVLGLTSTNTYHWHIFIEDVQCV